MESSEFHKKKKFNLPSSFYNSVECHATISNSWFCNIFHQGANQFIFITVFRFSFSNKLLLAANSVGFMLRPEDFLIYRYYDVFYFELLIMYWYGNLKLIDPQSPSQLKHTQCSTIRKKCNRQKSKSQHKLFWHIFKHTAGQRV